MKEKVVKIQPGRIVTLFYRLTDERGVRVCQSLSDAPVVFVFGEQTLLGGAEQQIAGLQPGDTVRLRLEPGEVFCEQRNRLRLPRPQELPPTVLRVGAAVIGSVNGEEQVVWIRDVTERQLVVETGDPLAGRALELEIGILDVQDRETVADAQAG